jgi:hypothetical protein
MLHHYLPAWGMRNHRATFDAFGVLLSYSIACGIATLFLVSWGIAGGALIDAIILTLVFIFASFILVPTGLPVLLLLSPLALPFLGEAAFGSPGKMAGYALAGLWLLLVALAGLTELKGERGK